MTLEESRKIFESLDGIEWLLPYVYFDGDNYALIESISNIDHCKVYNEYLDMRHAWHYWALSFKATNRK